MVKRWFSLIIAFLLLVGCAGATLALEPFPLKAYVTDRAGLLSESEQQQLGGELAQYDKATGNQLLVVTVPSLEDRELIEFTEALFQLNKPGQKGKDNGIILFVAKNERKLRFEVGYGLEGVVPDGKAGAIIREEISPRFKAGDYYGGIQAGMFAVIHAISPDYTIAGQDQPAPVAEKQRGDHSFPAALVVGLIIFGLVSMAGNRGNRTHQGRLRRGYSEPWYWGGGGGFGGGSGGWPGGGGDSGGGGFSGGGGSFGGGGASGDW